MKLIIDAMGGDHAPLEIVKGALQGQKRLGVELVLTGDEAAIMEDARKSSHYGCCQGLWRGDIACGRIDPPHHRGGHHAR